MKLIERKFCLLILLILVSSSAFGQNDELEIQKNVWRLRAETITGNLLKETTKISNLECALLFAKLGELWWKHDQNVANAFFEKAVDTIFFYSPNNKKNDKKEYFSASRNILLVVGNHSPKQANRLTKILSETDKEFEDERNLNADVLMKYALQIVRENPNQAFQIGIIALRTGVPKEFYKLIFELRRNNRNLADRLFREAFSITKTSPSYDMLQGIQLAVLPESITTNFPSEISATTQQKTEVLNFLADFLVELSAKKRVKAISSCSSEAILVSRSMKFFETLLPQKAGIVRQAIDFCVESQNQGVFENLADPANSFDIDELLSLAEKNKDNFLLRIAYLTKAAILANNQEKYALVLKIVNGLTEEDLASDEEFWQSLRYNAAGNLAYIQFQEGNSQIALRTFQYVPQDYQPFAGMIFINKFSLEDNSSYGFRVKVLEEIRNGFLESERPFTEKSNYWFQLIKIFADYKLETQASEVFKEIVKSYNEFIFKQKENKTQIESNEILTAFSATLLEDQENSIFETVGLISESKSRLTANLAFLKITLQKLESLNSVSNQK